MCSRISYFGVILHKKITFAVFMKINDNVTMKKVQNCRIPDFIEYMCYMLQQCKTLYVTKTGFCKFRKL